MPPVYWDVLMLSWRFHASLKPLNQTKPWTHTGGNSHLNTWSADCLAASFFFLPFCTISPVKDSFWKWEVNYRLYFSDIAMSQISQSPNGLVSCSWQVSKKAILSAPLINSKTRPYHTPQTLLSTSENNNEPSRMNYRSSNTLKNHMSILVHTVNFGDHLKAL